jgi:adenosylcobinamide-GDP ribazoletransferase
MWLWLHRTPAEDQTEQSIMPPLRDQAPQLLSDIASSFGLLTRLPTPRSETHRADAAWCWPLVGLVVGAMAAGVGAAFTALGLPALMAAAGVMAVSAIVTGGLHEDGLADTADGLFGGWTRERRLEIMKDSHIGSYGTLALLIVGLARAAALAALLEAGVFGAIIAAAAISRAPMAVLMAVLPNARGTGLAQSVGRPSRWAASGAVVLAIGLTITLSQGVLAMVIAAALATFGVAVVARARIGGQTGDVLGATQQLAELAALATASALLIG